MDDAPKPPTRECPFCCETIRADALKCRFCASSLLPPTELQSTLNKESDPGYVTYTFDNDTVRFAKVAVTLLTAIVVVFGSLTGFDLKTAAKDANDSAKKARDSSDAIDKVRSSVADNQKKLDDLQATLDSKLRDIDAKLARIDEGAKAADHLIASDAKIASASSSVSAFTQDPLSNDSIAKQSFTVPEIARLYNFPAALQGAGQNIALIELGGSFNTTDLQSYFSLLKLPTPKVDTVSVDQAVYKSEGPNSADAQVATDIEVAGAIAPLAHFTVCFALNTNQGFAHAVQRATNDPINPPAIMLISWGGPESSYTKEGVAELDQALHEAANRNITILCDSGDSGASDGTAGQAVDYPASSLWVLSVGGTSLKATNAKILKETAWNQSSSNMGATGGGVSKLFPQPPWQQGLRSLVGKQGRGVPDIAANADPSSGYAIRVDGRTIVIGGTNIAGALWAGLFALLNQGVGHRLGYVNPLLYRNLGPSGAFNDILQGNNTVGKIQGCQAGLGYDLCTGWGTPNGVKLLEAFRNARP